MTKKGKRLCRAAGAVLAAVLSVLLVSAAAISVNHALHSALHGDAQVSHSLCLICAFAKGHMSVAEPAASAAVLVLTISLVLRLTGAPFAPLFDYRLAPSRAPPTI